MRTATFFEQKRADARSWARKLLSLPADQWCILDTETTGLESHDQVVQISVIDGAGEPLINNQLIRPTVPINREAESVHGITVEQLVDAPTFAEFVEQLDNALRNRIVVIYNANYDSRMLRQSLLADGNEHVFDFHSECAMQRYAEWFGEWNDRRGQFRWQRLHGGDHSSLGDCRAVYKLIRNMATIEETEHANM